MAFWVFMLCNYIIYDKSAVADHALTQGHKIHFENKAILVKTTGFYNLARREAIEI